MAAAHGALVAQGADVDRADDDLLARAGIGLGQDAAVEVDDHAAARPGERRVVGAGSPPWLAATT